MSKGFRKSRGSSIRAQVLTLVFALVIAAGAVLTYTIFLYVNDELAHEQRDLHEASGLVAASIGKDIGDARTTLSRLAALPAVRESRPGACDPAFRILPGLDSLVDQLGLRGLDGRRICSYLPNAAAFIPVTRPWFARALGSQEFTASDAWLGTYSHRWVTVLTYPVRNAAGAQIAKLVLPMDLAELGRRNLSSYAERYDVWVLGRDGRVLMRSRDQERWVGKRYTDGSLDAAQQRAVPGPAEFTDASGGLRIRAAARVPATDWVVVVTQPRSALIAAAWRRAGPALWLGIPLLALLALLAYAMARRIVRPIQALGRAAGAVAAGDVSVRVIPDGPAELRQVAGEFNRMLEAKVLIDRETHEHQQWASKLMENASDATFIVDADRVIRYASPSLRDIMGYEVREVAGRSYLDFIHAADARACVAELDLAAASSEPSWFTELRFRRKDGRWVPVESVAHNALDDPTLAGIVISVRDLSDRKRSVAALARMRDFYQVLSETNQAIVRKTNREELFAEICRVAVEHARVHFATVVLLEGDGPGMRFAAKYGDDAGYLDRITVSASDAEPVGVGPIGKSIRSNAPVLSNDFEHDPAAAAWREAARRAGVRAVASFPLRSAGRAIGALYFCADEVGFFSPDIVPTLEQMATDVSFALDNFAREAERTSAHEQLKLQAAILKTQQETSLDAILVVDGDGRIISYNPQFLDMFRAPPEVVVGGDDRPMLRWAAAQVADEEQFLARVQQLYAHRDETGHDEVALKDGRTIARYSAPMVGHDGRYYGRVWYFRDITERKEAEQRIRRLNLLYATLSGSNAAVIRSGSRAELSAALCKVIDRYGGGVGAWVGFVDGATGRVVPGAWSLSMAEAMPQAVSIDPGTPHARDPVDIAAETGAAYFCNDVQADPAFRPWKRLCLDRGVGSAAVIPLRTEAGFAGVIALYAGQKDFFTRDIQALLEQLGSDMSFAVESLDREQRRKRAEAALAESEERYRNLVEQELIGTAIIQDGHFAYTNPHMAQLLGYGDGELVGVDALAIVDPADQALVRENMRKRLSGEVRSTHYSFRARRKDGTTFPAEVYGSASTIGGRPAIVGLLQDISERAKAREMTERHVAELESTMLGTIHAMSSMVEVRDPYTAGHERRVSDIATAIGVEMGLPENVVRGIRVAGALHDIGKIACPAEILSKPARLTGPEFDLVKGHAQQGHEILKAVRFPWPVAEIVLQHHERLDGSGYPNGLKGEAILLEARILAVADTVESMASHRPYRPARGIDAALDEIAARRGKLYDAQVVDACLRLFREKRFTLVD